MTRPYKKKSASFGNSYSKKLFKLQKEQKLIQNCNPNNSSSLNLSPTSPKPNLSTIANKNGFCKNHSPLILTISSFA